MADSTVPSPLLAQIRSSEPSSTVRPWVPITNSFTSSSSTSPATTSCGVTLARRAGTESARPGTVITAHADWPSASVIW